MSKLNETELFLNELNPVDVRRDLSDLYDGYLQNQNEQGNFKYEDVSHKFYVIRRLGELLDHLNEHGQQN